MKCPNCRAEVTETIDNQAHPDPNTYPYRKPNAITLICPKCGAHIEFTVGLPKPYQPPMEYKNDRTDSH